MRRCVLLMLCLAFVAAPRETSADGDDLSAAPLLSGVPLVVFLSPDGPVFLRIDLQIDGGGMREVRAAYAEKLFQSLDRDGDGRLDAEEAAQARSLLPPGSAVPLPDRAADGGVPLDEFTEYVQAALGAPLTVVNRPLRPELAVDLFSLLDRDGDGRLSAEELRDAAATLAPYDRDGDETFSLEELSPAPDAPEAQTPRGTDERSDVPFRVVVDTDAGAIADELLQLYGTGGEGARQRGLPLSQSGLDAAAFSAFDADADGRLDAQELARLLREFTPAVQLRAELPNRTPRRPALTALSEAAVRALAAQPAGRDRLSLDLNGVTVDVRARGPRMTAYDVRQFFRLQFRIADADGNKYLDEQEFAQLSLPGATFRTVDRDGDGMIFEEELIAWVDQEADRSRNRAVFAVAREGRSLFEILDADGDGRLSPRELMEAGRRLAEFDRNGNGTIEFSEVTGQYAYQVTVELSGDGLLEVQPRGAAVPAAQRLRPLPRRTEGPEWFRRMDRNADGDVSWSEFLGPREVFDRLDLDGDGLIDADEAAAAGRE